MLNYLPIGVFCCLSRSVFPSTCRTAGPGCIAPGFVPGTGSETLNSDGNGEEIINQR